MSELSQKQKMRILAIWALLFISSQGSSRGEGFRNIPRWKNEKFHKNYVAQITSCKKYVRKTADFTWLSRATGSLPSVVTWCNTHRVALRSAGTSNTATSSFINSHSETQEREYPNDEVYEAGLRPHASETTAGSTMAGETRPDGRERRESSGISSGILLSKRENNHYSSIVQGFTSEFTNLALFEVIKLALFEFINLALFVLRSFGDDFHDFMKA
jgi:hypothetical protein